MKTGDKIKIFRTNKKWTQKKLAEESGIHEVQIRRYENGSINPKFNNLNKIANALGVPYSELMNNEDLAEVPEESDFMKSLEIPSQDKKELHAIQMKLKQLGFTVIEESRSIVKGVTTHSLTFADVNSNTVLLDLNQIKDLNKETDDFLRYQLEKHKNKTNDQ